MASTPLSRWRGRLSWRQKRRKAAEEAAHAAQAKLDAAKADEAYAKRVIARHSKAASLRERAHSEATKALARHIIEVGGNNRGTAVEEIINYAGGDVPEPWCVDFVIWCYGHAGSKVVKPGWYRAVRYMNESGTVKTTAPLRGDIVRFTFDHTGIYAKDNGDGTITTIEGNTGPAAGNDGDGLYRKTRSKGLVRDYLRVTS